MHPVSFSSVPKLSEDLLARIFAFYRKSQTAIKKSAKWPAYSKCLRSSKCGRVFSQKLERNWGKKEKTKSTWTKKEIGERSEQRVARGGELGGGN